MSRAVLDTLREIRERIDEVTEVPIRWVDDYHAVLDATPELRYRFGLRISESEQYLSREPFDELSRPMTSPRLVCGRDNVIARVERAIAFYD